MKRSELIRARRKAAGHTQETLAARIGVTRNAVTKWENGENDSQTIEGPNTFKLEKELGIDAESLNSGHPKLVSERGVPVSRSSRRLPLISLVQAGRAREVIDDYMVGDADDFVDLDDALARQLGKSAFALRIEGFSMSPDFNEGDLVIVDPNVGVRPGEFVVAYVERDQGATLKKYRDRGGDTFDLVPLNPDYATVTIGPDNPGHIIGVVVEHRRKLRR